MFEASIVEFVPDRATLRVLNVIICWANGPMANAATVRKQPKQETIERAPIFQKKTSAPPGPRLALSKISSSESERLFNQK